MGMAIGAAQPAFGAAGRIGAEQLPTAHARQAEQTGATPAGAPQDATRAADAKKAEATQGCQTCKNRKYQDGSDDPGVSFKTPQRIDPNNAASAVAAHEQEHVSHEQAKAKAEGREILFQSVTLHTGICGECGKTYIAGGTTKTVSRAENAADRFRVGLPEKESGKMLLANI